MPMSWATLTILSAPMASATCTKPVLDETAKALASVMVPYWMLPKFCTDHVGENCMGELQLR